MRYAHRGRIRQVVEYKHEEEEEEEEEEEDESIDHPGRNDVPAQLPLVRQNASAPTVHPEANDCIMRWCTEEITISDTEDE
jgi:hypothetical protein